MSGVSPPNPACLVSKHCLPDIQSKILANKMNGKAVRNQIRGLFIAVNEIRILFNEFCLIRIRYNFFEKKNTCA